MEDKKVKIEDGEEYTADAYLYVGDPEHPSTWKLRIEETPGKVTIAQLGRAAAALGKGFRGNRVDLPLEEKRKAAQRLIALYHQLDVADEDIPAHLFDLAGMGRKAIFIKEKPNRAKVAGYGIVWGGVDLVGDTFDPAVTDLWLDKITKNPPILIQHGMDEKFGLQPVGRIEKIEPDDVGLWVEGWIEMHEKYLEALESLARQGKIGWSSGSAGHLVQRDKGLLRSWPIIEFSLTPMPAEPRTLGVEIVKSLVNFSPEISSLLDGVKMEENKFESKDAEPMEVTMPEINLDELAVKVAERLPILNSPKDTGTATPNDEVKQFKLALTGAVKLQTGVGSEGGYFVPTPLYDELVIGLGRESIFRQAKCRVFNLPGKTVKVPGFGFSTAAAIRAEGSPATATNLTATQVTFDAKAYAKLTKVTAELAMNSQFDIWGEILQYDFVHAFAEAENQDFTKGNGTTQPEGIVNAPIGKTTASKNAVTPDEIIEWIFSLDYRYRPRAVIMASDSLILQLRKLKDNNGQFLWQPGLSGGMPGTLLGIPLYANPYLDAMGTANGIPAVIFDPSYYWIGIRAPMEVQRLVELYAPDVGFLANQYMDAHIMLPEAFRALKLAAS